MTTISKEDEIVALTVSTDFRGSSAGEISIGASESDLLKRYGPPARVLHLSRGESWIYTEGEIAFRLQGEKVVSWTLFML